ncbi:hypothetical protein DM02DRAFT_285259 [Periconia macrospinosa]|uniref:Uncharacterized protein n=1 Tax=Periconia macrospinosa TaxID=97972 RepID=A0A2V1EB73_9PLEO|nr:hypothetical protein DM02DRAFT_285259 [Periconia macrospinosa]
MLLSNAFAARARRPLSHQGPTIRRGRGRGGPKAQPGLPDAKRCMSRLAATSKGSCSSGCPSRISRLSNEAMPWCKTLNTGRLAAKRMVMAVASQSGLRIPFSSSLHVGTSHQSLIVMDGSEGDDDYIQYDDVARTDAIEDSVLYVTVTKYTYLDYGTCIHSLAGGPM